MSVTHRVYLPRGLTLASSDFKAQALSANEKFRLLNAWRRHDTLERECHRILAGEFFRRC
jgi:hypothetical protein